MCLIAYAFFNVLQQIKDVFFYVFWQKASFNGVSWLILPIRYEHVQSAQGFKRAISHGRLGSNTIEIIS
jgi:hypothetical protein